MCHNVYQVISFKLGVMIDSTELCILILVWVTLTLIQDVKGKRKQTILHQSSHRAVDLVEHGTLLVQVCEFNEPHTHFIWSNLESQLRWFYEK